MQIGQTLFGWRQISIAALVIIAMIEASVNAYEEQLDGGLGIILAAWWFMPLLILILYLLGVEFRKSVRLNYAPAVILSLLHALAYSYYAFNGKADSLYTSGHLHIIFVPLLSGVFSSPVIVIMLLRLVFFGGGQSPKAIRLSS